MWGIYKNRPPRTHAKDNFSKLDLICFSILVNWVYFICDPTHFDPVFLTHSLQIHCFGLLGPQSIHLGPGLKSGPYNNILLKLYLFIQLKNSNSLSSFIILMIKIEHDIRCIVKWGGKIDKVAFEVLKAKIFSTTTVNALTSTKKKKFLACLVLKKKHYFVFVFVFVGKLLNLNVFRNNDFEYL